MLRKDPTQTGVWQAMLVDLDWAGVEGQATYPPSMAPHSSGIPWHKDAQPGQPLRQEHDLHLLEMLF